MTILYQVDQTSVLISPVFCLYVCVHVLVEYIMFYMAIQDAFFQDIDSLQNHGIVSFILSFSEMVD